MPLYTVGRRRLRRRDPAVRLRPEPSRPARRARSRSTPIPTWSRRPSTSATASCSSTTWTSPRSASKWRVWIEPRRGSMGSELGNARRSRTSPDAGLAAPGSRRVRQRLARPHAARAEPAVRHRRPGITPAALAPIQWTHWDDAATSTASPPTAARARTWDNIGVQYGLQALRDGHITPAEFLDLNARVGGWKESKDMVQEGCPFARPRACPAHRPWSARNMHPRGRRRDARAAAQGDLDRDASAPTRSGLVFDGDDRHPDHRLAPLPRGELDMHNAHQSFAIRQRMLEHDGDASNQVIWFTDARPASAVRPDAEALAGDGPVDGRTSAHPWRGVAGNKPGRAWTAASTTTGRRSPRAPTRLGRRSRHEPPGACTPAFPHLLRPRASWRAARSRGLYKCALQPVTRRSRAGSTASGTRRGGARTPEGDLPRRGLRLREGRRGQAAGLLGRHGRAVEPRGQSGLGVPRPGSRSADESLEDDGVAAVKQPQN